MKILFLHEAADPALGGGGEVIIWEQMRGLRDAGHDCALLAVAPEPGLRRNEREGITVWTAGIRNFYWPFHQRHPTAPLRLLWHAVDAYNLCMQAYIKQVVSKEHPDVASLHGLAGWSAASWLTFKRLDVPVVQVLHGSSAICPRSTMRKRGKNCERQCTICRVFRLPHRSLSRQVRAVVGVSQFILNRHQALGYFHDVSIQRVIHNARAPSSLGLTEKHNQSCHEGLRFGYIGRLDETKGIEILLEAFLSAGLRNAELWIAGHGKHHYEEKLRRKFTDKELRFIGYVKPDTFFPEVDVVIVPSLWNDTLPGVVFEALAFGKPVIASRRGGIPEMIKDGSNGLLFDPDKPGELRSLLRRIYSDELLRNSLSAHAAPTAQPFLDTVAWIAAFEALYKEAASLDAKKYNG